MIVQKKKQNVAIVEWASTPKANVNKIFLASQILGNKKFLEVKRNDNKEIKKIRLNKQNRLQT